jgi:hypothetical protein
MQKDLIYRIDQYVCNGIRIDALCNGDCVQYFLVMNVQTPMGPVEARPEIPATTIKEAFEKAPEIAEIILDKLKQDILRAQLTMPASMPAATNPGLRIVT